MSDEHENVVTVEGPGGFEHPVSVPAQLPILPLRDTVLFSNSFMPLAVARESSIHLIESRRGGRKDGLASSPSETPLSRSPYRKTYSDRHDDAHTQDVQAGRRQPALDRPGLGPRCVSTGSSQTQPFIRADVSKAEELALEEDRLEVDALQRNIKNNFQKVVSLSPLLSDDLQALAANIPEPGKLADFIASSLTTIPTRPNTGPRDARHQDSLDDLNRMLIKELEVLEFGVKDSVAGAVRGWEEPARVPPP